MMELVHRSSFEDPNFVEENAEFLNILEEGFEGTHVYPTLKAFRKRKDGRRAWMAIMSQYMSVEKWRGELKRVEGIVTKRVWKGMEQRLWKSSLPSIGTVIPLWTMAMKSLKGILALRKNVR